MHEMNLCQNVVRAVEEYLRREHRRKAIAVHLELDALSCAMPEAVRFGFRVASRGSAAEGARLILKTVPGSGWCADCERRYEVNTRYAACPRCGAVLGGITGGDQLRVTWIEVE